MYDFKEKVLIFISAIGSAYKEYDEREDFPNIELKADDMTEDFTAMLVAFHMLYTDIIDEEEDIIGFTHILNRLALQYVMKKDKKEV